MGNKKSMPTRDNINHDVTEAIYKSVGVMIARAAANKKEGKEFDIDLKQCKNFIKYQIELVPPTVSSKPDDNEVYCYISVVRKGNPHPIHVPIYHMHPLLTILQAVTRQVKLVHREILKLRFQVVNIFAIFSSSSEHSRRLNWKFTAE